jgi:AcrR family transcriptional regulator
VAATAREAGAAAEPRKAPYSKLRPGPGRSAAEVANHQRARIHSAMVQIVGQRGYRAVTARELTQLSGVSTRAFYENFGSKEECFLRTHELVVRRAVRSILAAQAGERNWQERLRLAFNAFVREVARQPEAGRLALVEAYSAGPASLERVRHAQCTFEAMVAESFGRAPDGVVVPQLVIEGIVAGAERVARARLARGEEGKLPELGDPLAEWALSYRGEAAALLADLDRRFVPEVPQSGSSPVPSSGTKNERDRARSAADDRALLLSAVAKLAAARGYEHLTPPRIRAVAGVPRRSFEVHFDGAEDCFLAALEERGSETITRAAAAGGGNEDWTGGVHRAIVSLCRQIASDSVLANLCFIEAFAPPAGMHCRERLMADLVALLRDAAPAGERVGDLAAEASVGAIWGVIHHHVVSGRSHQLPRIAATLSYLALAPAIGVQPAVAAIDCETSERVRKRRAEKLDRSSKWRNGHQADEILVPMR